MLSLCNSSEYQKSNSKQKARTIHNHGPLSGTARDSLAGVTAGVTSQAPPTETFVVCFLCQDPCSWNSTCCCSHFCPGASWRWGCQLRPRLYLDTDRHQAQPGKLASRGFMSSLLTSSSAIVILLEHSQSVL